jgi:hypothetical protein
MVITLNPLLSKADWCRYCIHLITLNTHNFKMVEAVGFKIMASRSPSMAGPAYCISYKTTNWFKNYWGWGHANRQMHRLVI